MKFNMDKKPPSEKMHIEVLANGKYRLSDDYSSKGFGSSEEDIDDLDSLFYNLTVQYSMNIAEHVEFTEFEADYAVWCNRRSERYNQAMTFHNQNKEAWENYLNISKR
jgi:hypothetical protein